MHVWARIELKISAYKAYSVNIEVMLLRKVANRQDDIQYNCNYIEFMIKSLLVNQQSETEKKERMVDWN